MRLAILLIITMALTSQLLSMDSVADKEEFDVSLYLIKEEAKQEAANQSSIFPCSPLPIPVTEPCKSAEISVIKQKKIQPKIYEFPSGGHSYIWRFSLSSKIRKKNHNELTDWFNLALDLLSFENKKHTTFINAFIKKIKRSEENNNSSAPKKSAVKPLSRNIPACIKRRKLTKEQKEQWMHFRYTTQPTH